jgi:hypothetical protein
MNKYNNISISFLLCFLVKLMKGLIFCSNSRGFESDLFD